MADPLPPAPPSSRAVVDLLAFERTMLANERTLLAYLRTALGFAAAGGMALRVAPVGPTEATVGAIGVAFGAVLAVVGSWRFVTTRARHLRLLGGV